MYNQISGETSASFPLGTRSTQAQQTHLSPYSYTRVKLIVVLHITGASKCSLFLFCMSTVFQRAADEVMSTRLSFLFQDLTFADMSSLPVLASRPPSCSGFTAPDCLISSRRIGDIRSNPVPTSPKSQQRGSAGMKSSGTAGISQCEEATGQDAGTQSMSS